MFASFYISARTRRRILISLAIVAAAALVLGVLLVIAGNAVLGSAVTSLIEQTESRYGAHVTVERARYFPFRGVSLREVEIAGLFAAGSVRIQISLATALRLRSYTWPSIPDLKPWNAVHVLWRVLGKAGADRVLPRRVVVRDVSIEYRLGDLTGTLACEHLSVEHDPDAAAVSASVLAMGTPEIRAGLEIGYKTRSLVGDLVFDQIVAAVPPFGGGELRGSLTFSAGRSGTFEIDADLSLENSSLNLPSIAEEIISPLNVGYRFAGRLDPHASLPPASLNGAGTPAGEIPRGSLAITRGDLTLNQVQMDFAPTFRGLFAVDQEDSSGTPDSLLRSGWLGLRISLPDTPLQRILGSIPTAVGGPLTSMKIDGDLRWDFALQVQLDDISEMKWNSNTVLTGFAVREIDPAYNTYAINDEFVHTIVDESVDFRRIVLIPAAREASMEWMLTHSEHFSSEIDGWRTEAQAIAAARPQVADAVASAVADMPVEADGAANVDASLTGESSDPDPAYRYTYLDDMSPWVIRAVLTAEDGDFFFYGGVNPVTLADAIERNVEAGEIVFGASTISMQLAKMLFLDQKRIFSRKLQEIFLVYLMEHHVPVAKDRILELYINLAEFGPGVFGIHDASAYYFAKRPRDLTAGEATWLASILPAPKTYHRYFESRWISDGWFIRMISIFDIMLTRGRMTQAEYDDAITRRPTFRE